MAPKRASPPASWSSRLFAPQPLFLVGTLLRLILLVYGVYQDRHSALKYTDIDYLVFTDASRFVAAGESPYARDTYRYTPLLAWMLVPTATWFFEFGKVVFALSDLLAGWLILRLLRSRGMEKSRAGAFAALWLWNPMVATISTRGSSEGLLGVLTAALVWAVERKRLRLAAVVLGVGVHFKIYPFIWAPAIVWWMDAERLGVPAKKAKTAAEKVLAFISVERIEFGLLSLATFIGLNALMYAM